MKELARLSSESLQSEKGRLGLLVLDESFISCQRLTQLRSLVDDLGGNVVLMMLAAQYQEGLRGFAKAQILNHVVSLAGVLSVAEEDFQEELMSGWRQVSIPASVVLEGRREIVSGEGRVESWEFPVTDSKEDRQWMKMVAEIIPSSNCWYDPAGCVFVRDGQLLVEVASTTYNNSRCKLIPLDCRELFLKEGERLNFCDSQHAESVGVSQAASRRVSLEASIAYVTKFPCRPCMQSMLGAGIAKVVFETGSYGLADAPLLLDNGVEIRKVKF